MLRASNAAYKIRAAMDSKVVGHKDLKTAILLALFAREHCYIEGPPGVAKTCLAEVAAAATGTEFFFYQMHRDTRLQELVGDAVIHREKRSSTSPSPAGVLSGGEVIRQRNSPGGILTAEVCVLDDISRAPGEALNVLLRILNERKFGADAIPLVTTIATANPATADGAYFTEPLDPANIDRFAVQVRATGLIEQQDWAGAKQVIQMHAAAGGSATRRARRRVLGRARAGETGPTAHTDTAGTASTAGAADGTRGDSIAEDEDEGIDEGGGRRGRGRRRRRRITARRTRPLPRGRRGRRRRRRRNPLGRGSRRRRPQTRCFLRGLLCGGFGGAPCGGAAVVDTAAPGACGEARSH